MIKIRRGAVPASLKGPRSAGGTETKAAIKAVLAKKKFEFKAYRGDDVVESLRAMFKNKCAYCEFKYAPGGPEDVEHFRPKGGVIVNGRLKKPGYYWLAAKWTNLLPACTDCNRRRSKKFHNGTSKTTGKGNFFPVEDEKLRWRSHEKKCFEKPLLLDPCKDDPGKHLEFMKDGLVQPVLLKDGKESELGKKSIEVYGLLRRDLVEDRAKKQARVRVLLQVALQAADLAAKAKDAGDRVGFEGMAASLLKEARSHLAKDEPYLAAARSVFHEFGLKTV